MRRSRSLCACVVAVALLAGVFASSAAALPAKFWGVVPQAAPTAEQLQRLKRGGVDSIRLPVSWAAAQPSQGGAFQWVGPDEIVGRAASAGIDVFPFLFGAPTWALPHDRRYSSPKFLPVKTGAQRAAWTAFLQAAVARYGPNGSFWAENPGIPKRPLRTWQIWNEENFEYFVARPNPGEYGKLVKISSAAIKGVDPAAKIILGGMFSKPKEAEFKRKPPLAYFASDFLDRMYETTPGIKSKFQGVALHPYTGSYKRLTPYIEEFRKVLKANHDAGKPLWITELGWSSQKPAANNSFAKGRGGQKAQLRGAFSLLRKNQAKWRLQGVYWFSIDDQAATCNFCDGSGLFGDGFAPKPAWRAYVKFAGGKP